MEVNCMKIRFTADSTCDMSVDFIERYQVKVFPLSVQMGDKLYKDGVDITPEEIITRVNAGENLPKTSAVNAAEYREVFEELLRDCDAILHFSISSEMSCSYQNACLAAEDLPVYCVDSRSLSSGIALLLAEAADMAEEGKDAAEIAEALKSIQEKLDVSFILDRLDYLYKGGRCSMLTMLGANVLHLRPCIEVRDGKMGVGKKYRGTYERCLKQYVADRLKDAEQISAKRVYLTHTGISPEALKMVRKMALEAIPFADVFETRAGCTITSHCGDNTFGILMVRK